MHRGSRRCGLRSDHSYGDMRLQVEGYHQCCSTRQSGSSSKLLAASPSRTSWLPGLPGCESAVSPACHCRRCSLMLDACQHQQTGRGAVRASAAQSPGGRPGGTPRQAECQGEGHGLAKRLAGVVRRGAERATTAKAPKVQLLCYQSLNGRLWRRYW